MSLFSRVTSRVCVSLLNAHTAPSFSRNRSSYYLSPRINKWIALVQQTPLSYLSSNCRSANSNNSPGTSQKMLSVGVIGSGNWGTAVAKVIGENIERMAEAGGRKYERLLRMYVYEELVNGEKLTDIINQQRENVKYLPGFELPTCVFASNDLEEVGRRSDILLIVMPHQFLVKQCQALKHSLKPGSFAASLCKGFMDTGDEDVTLISKYISSTLGIPCHVIMGASIANEVAGKKFCEATIGSKNAEHGAILKELFESSYFRATVSSSAEVVELCGAMKNVVAVAAGFCDGLGYGDNTKAAVIRIGFTEMIQLAKLLFPGHDESVFMESCGVADLIATCYGGRNRRVAEAFARENKSLDTLEREMLNGQKLQGPSAAKDVMVMLRKQSVQANYPLFTAVYEICYGARPVNTILEALAERGQKF